MPTSPNGILEHPQHSKLRPWFVNVVQNVVMSWCPRIPNVMSLNNTFFDEDLQKNILKLLGNCERGAHVIACPTAAAKFTLDVLHIDKGLHLGMCFLMHPPSQCPCVHLPSNCNYP